MQLSNVNKPNFTRKILFPLTISNDINFIGLLKLITLKNKWVIYLLNFNS